MAADPARAFYWYQKVGCELAGYQLGKMYELGEGTVQDYTKAADCYRKGMERAAFARLGLAQLTEKGLGVTQDKAAALTLYRESAEREIGGVAFEIAMNFDLGRGLPNDLEQAARWWMISACYNNGGAALNLARKYASGTGVPRSPMAAYVWTALGGDTTYSAKSAHEQIQQQFPVQAVKEGDEYIEKYRERKKAFGAFYGESSTVVKMSEAELRQAAASMNIDALFSLAYRIGSGEGVASDPDAASRLYRQAVFEARADLYEVLGQEYKNGMGHAKDPKVAVDLYRHAAEAGSVEAQYRLGLAYQAGESVGKDPTEAYKWFLLSCDGKAEAKSKLDDLQQPIEMLWIFGCRSCDDVQNGHNSTADAPLALVGWPAGFRWVNATVVLLCRKVSWPEGQERRRRAGAGPVTKSKSRESRRLAQAMTGGFAMPTRPR